MNGYMPKQDYDQLICFLGICQPQEGCKLKDVYDPETNGCRDCKQKDGACAMLRESEYI